MGRLIRPGSLHVSMVQILSASGGSEGPIVTPLSAQQSSEGAVPLTSRHGHESREGNNTQHHAAARCNKAGQDRKWHGAAGRVGRLTAESEAGPSRQACRCHHPRPLQNTETWRSCAQVVSTRLVYKGPVSEYRINAHFAGSEHQGGFSRYPIRTSSLYLTFM